VTLKRLLLSLSIANLCFITMWTDILGLAGNPGARYFEAQAPDMKLVWALIIDILALAALIFSGFVLREKDVRAFRVAGTLFIGFFSLFGVYQLLRSVNTSLYQWLPGHSVPILKFAIASIALFLLVRFPKRARWAIKAFLLIFSPLFPILALNGLVLYRTVDLREVGKGKAAGMLPPRPDENRVIWIVFDELDQRILFEARPNRIHATEFDRLRAESIYADHVKTPAWDTVLSIPALLSGQVITDAKLNTSKLLVKFKHCPEWKDFNSEPNVFRRARAAGFDTAVSGWDHPYGRVMGNSLSDCSWDICATYVLAVARFLHSQPLYYNAFYLAAWQAHQVPALYSLSWASPAPQLHRIAWEAHISVARFVAENALRMARNRDLDLVFVHFPIPHLPGIWNSKSQSFTTEDSDYVDNLQFADKFLGEVRGVLEQNGDWDRSTILVSSDHPYREFYWGPPDTAPHSRHDTQPYVPFLLKLPGQHDEVVYHRGFNNVLSADLLFEALEGRVRTAPQAVKWLDSRATSTPDRSKSNCP
jgi:hypothetical protein